MFMYACIYIYMYVCLYIHMRIYMDVYICVCVCACVCVYIYIRICMCVYIYMYLCITCMCRLLFSIGEWGWGVQLVYGCERCLLITESPKTPGHYRYLIWVLVLKGHVRARGSTLWQHCWHEASEFLCTKTLLFGESWATKNIAKKPRKCSLRRATNVMFSKFREWRRENKNRALRSSWWFFLLL